MGFHWKQEETCYLFKFFLDIVVPKTTEVYTHVNVNDFNQFINPLYS